MTRGRLIFLLGAVVTLAVVAGVWFLHAPRPARRSLEDAIFDKASEGMRRTAHLRLRFTDEDGRPLDNVEVRSERFIAGGWEGKTVRDKMVGNRVFDLDLKGTTVDLDFAKDGYFRNSLSLDLTQLPSDASLENGVPLIERTVVLMRENGVFPELRSSERLSVWCWVEDDATSCTLIDPFAKLGPKSREGYRWPLPDGMTGVAFVPLPAAGVEVLQEQISVGRGEHAMVDISPRDYQLALVILGGDEGDGLVRAIPLNEPSCRDRFPSELAEAPQGGYQSEVRLSPDDFVLPGNLKYVYFYYRLKDHYGKIFLRMSQSESPKPGEFGVRMSGLVVVNAVENDRNLRMPPCN